MTETINAVLNADAYIDSNTPKGNWGINDNLKIEASATRKYRSILRFRIPKYNGVMKTQTLKLFVTAISSTDTFVTAVIYLVKSPQDDLWIEGTSNVGADNEGVCWDDYAEDLNWDTAGGDFEATPIAVRVFDTGLPLSQYYDIDIPLDIINFDSEGQYSLLIKVADETSFTKLMNMRSGEHASTPILELQMDIDDFAAINLTAEAISSTQIDISWDKTQLADENFTHYLLEQSDTGVGGWTTLATITDKDTVKYEHTGVVVQGDVDDYDEDLDTYPNGRTKYYRLSVVSDVFGATGYGTDEATTIPAIRPVNLSFNPRSKFWDADFIDDNLTYKPYGVEVIPSWYDINDFTEENYIDKLTVEAYFRGASTWPGTASETNDFSPVNFISGGIIEGDVGYKPYKIKGKIYDTGGLYRKATTDKTTEQFDVAWPAPCPVAIPDGDYADAPPALLGRPFSAGDLIPIDLSKAGQQSGENIYDEGFTGTPADNGKWDWTLSNASVPVYGTGLGGSPTIRTIHTSATTSRSSIYKKLIGQDSPSNINDKYFSKYTGGYQFRTVVRFDNTWTFTVGVNLCISTAMWKNTSLNGGGYDVLFQYGSNFMFIYQRGNFLSDSILLASIDLGSDHPFQSLNKGKFIYVDITTSPYFGLSGEGDVITIVYNIDNTLSGVQNIDYKTHPYIFVITSNNHNPNDQQHYTGRCMISAYTTSFPPSQTNALFEIYVASITGRVNGSGYGAKNLTLNEILQLVTSPIPTFPISCAPDQASQLCYIEGRIKNEYGAQSRTGEVDDYQGDTFNNAIPIGFLSVPKTGFVGADVLIDASQSIDPEGGTLIYKYDFGDTETLETSQSSVSHQYASPGTYTVKLIVEDEAGLLSVEVQSIITVYDALVQFEEVTLMSPWESISDSSPTGTNKTSHPELDYDTIQGMEGGNRIFSLTGQHHDPDCDIDLATRITNAENERDYVHTLKNKAVLITLDLVFFGKVRGVITDHVPSMTVDDQQAFKFSMTFQEVDVRQFE